MQKVYSQGIKMEREEVHGPGPRKFPPKASECERVPCKYQNTGFDFTPIVMPIPLSGFWKTRMLIL